MTTVADESTACACGHQPYDHGRDGCRVIRSNLLPCGCRRRRAVLERAAEIMDEIQRAPRRPRDGRGTP